MKVSWHQIPGGPEIRVYLISQEEFDRNVEARRQRRLGNLPDIPEPWAEYGGTFPGGNDLN